MPLRRVEEVMGMPVTILVADPDPSPAAVTEAFADFRLLDRTFSPFLPESAVWRINAGTLRLEAAPELVSRAAELCRLFEVATEGCFSAWRQGVFDPSGLVKGWALDRAAGILAAAGCRDFVVDAGGDALARGVNGREGPWRIGVRHPGSRARVACVLAARDLAVATSGTYEKGEHIVDPRTGEPARHWLSFTVTGPDILAADVYATAACVMGEGGLDFVARQPGYEALAFNPGLSAAWTPGFEALCSSPPEPSSVAAT